MELEDHDGAYIVCGQQCVGHAIKQSKNLVAIFATGRDSMYDLKINIIMIKKNINQKKSPI